MLHAALHGQELPPCPKLHTKEKRRETLLPSFIVSETKAQGRRTVSGFMDGEMGRWVGMKEVYMCRLPFAIFLS